ncbi:CDP-diacylglycerol-inositol 3-phosphatidyltransferase [Lobulomyces angularis]|nr:CDP-diacylglycerol-inositol 3-phosphatidyltransferase [Lobulomyces angularis]
MFFYLLSAVLDAFDGQAARYFNQSTKFGSVLDMVTDRSTTTCLLVHLAIQNPNYALVFQLLISLDFSSHYMHMYAQIHSGAESHKNISKSSNKLLHLYYTNSNVLFGVCAASCFPVCLFKQIVNVIQLINASNSLVKVDLRLREDLKKRK